MKAEDRRNIRNYINLRIAALDLVVKEWEAKYEFAEPDEESLCLAKTICEERIFLNEVINKIYDATLSK